MHPLAGQGLNLGLYDAGALVTSITDALQVLMPCRVPLCSSPFSCRIAALPTMPCVPAPFLFSCHRIATALPLPPPLPPPLPHCHRIATAARGY